MALTKLLFMGMPGTGKGTQAKLLTNLTHISTGEVIREAFAKKDALLIPYQEHIEKGGFLPDELIFKLIKQQIQYSNGYILDGAVRTIPQAEFVFKEELVDAVFEFHCPEKEARKRLALRREKEHRKDDSPEAIEKRFKEYYLQTFQAEIFAVNHFKNYFIINATQSIEQVHKDILKILNPNSFYI